MLRKNSQAGRHVLCGVSKCGRPHEKGALELGRALFAGFVLTW
jgi:hypothetical protein